MLLAVEGGGFFSSSASGYSKGLTLLLLGQKRDDKPMRVTPWNQYQLVDHETCSDIQLDSHKNCLVRGCSSFVCFGRATAVPDSSSPLQVGPTQQQDVLPEVCPIHEEKDLTSSPGVVVEEDSIKKITIKSSLRKPKNGIEVSCVSNEEREVFAEEGQRVGSETERRKKLAVPRGCDEEHKQPREKGNEVSAQMIRKVQWPDTSGGELVEIREFEPSDDGRSDDEFHNGSEKTCSCIIM